MYSPMQGLYKCSFIRDIDRICVYQRFVWENEIVFPLEGDFGVSLGAPVLMCHHVV